MGEGFHYYSLLIDGVAVSDPGSETFYGMGRMASGIEVPFKGGEYYALKDVPHGDIRMKRYYSEVSRSWRRFFVYTPAGYDTHTAEKYPVLYLLHGGGEDERGWATQGKTDLIMDTLIAEGKAKPMLIVMLDGNMASAGFNAGALKAFEAELMQAVIPFVEDNYRVRKKQTAGHLQASLWEAYKHFMPAYTIQICSLISVYSVPDGYLSTRKSQMANTNLSTRIKQQ